MNKIEQIGNEMFDYIDTYVYQYLRYFDDKKMTKEEVKARFKDMLCLKFTKMLNGE
jgi:type III secretory pathway component EscU